MWPDSKGLNCTVLTRCPRVTVHAGLKESVFVTASANRLNVTMMVDIKLDTLLPATEVNYPRPRCPALVCRPGRGLTFKTSGGALSNSATSTFQHLQLPGPGW